MKGVEAEFVSMFQMRKPSRFVHRICVASNTVAVLMFCEDLNVAMRFWKGTKYLGDFPFLSVLIFQSAKDFIALVVVKLFLSP